MTSLGPFALRARLGKGGMAEVWRAEHTALARPAAIKVIRPHSSTDRDPLRREIEAVAALDHPHVVRLYDFGTVEEDGGTFARGSRWLAMELADAGSLHASYPVDWTTAGRLLLQILSALAHAHARGVVHRDLKPENVLLARVRAGVRVKLTDFGIATPDPSLAEELGDAPRVAGTPLFMAPEQLRGSWRDFGPATDLYALGCIAHELCCGTTPFRADTVPQIIARHFEARPAPFDPTFEVPAGVREWVERLYAPRYEQRFAYAADAARALLALDPTLTQHGALHLMGEQLKTRPLQESRDTDPRVDALAEALLETIGFEPVADDDSRPSRPPAGHTVGVPVSWAEEPLPASPDLLVGLGAGLFGVRQVPYVGRVPQRERLWRALRDCDRERSPRAVVLRGVAGVGKTRLAEWVAQRAAELGAGVRLKALCDPMAPGGAALGQMVARRLRCMGLPPERARARLDKAWGDELDVDAVVELLHGPRAERPAPERAALRFATFHAVLRELASRRPVIVWIEDAQWDLPTLEAVAQCLERSDLGALPALFLLTVREEDVEGPAEEALARLTKHERASAMRLGPMEHEEIRALTTSMLQLDPVLALEVAARAGGSPLFAIQTLRDWVQADALELGPEGLRLADGARSRVARDVESLWRNRLQPALDELADPEAGRHALELAAVLGVEIDLEEWKALREAAGVAVDVARLSEALTSRGLILWAEHGFSFAHATLRQSLLSGQEAAGRSRENLRLAARVLEARAGDHAADRRAALLLSAGDAEAAVRPFLVAARRAWGRGDYRLVDGLLSRREQALDEVGAPASDARRAEGRALRARALVHVGRSADARALAEAVVARTPDPSIPPPALTEAALVLARLAASAGDVVAFGEAHARIERFAAASGDQRLSGIAALTRADLARVRGFLDEAQQAFEEAIRTLEASGDPYEAASAAVGLAEVLRRKGRLEQSHATTLEAEAYAVKADSRLMVAQARSVRAELARARGELVEAEALHAEVRELLRALGHPNANLAVLNLAILKVVAGRFADAAELFTRAGRLLSDAGMHGFLPYVHAGLMTSCAAEEDWRGFDKALSEARRRLAWIDMVDPDLAMLFDRAGDLAADREPARAAAAYEQSIGQYANAGQSDLAGAVKIKRRALDRFL